MADRQPLSTDISNATTVGRDVLTAVSKAAGRAAIDAEGIETGRAVTFGDGSTSGSAVIPVQSNATLANGVFVGQPGGAGRWVSLAEFDALLSPSGYSAKINAELNQTYWQQGGTTQPPSQIGPLSWGWTDLATDGDGSITITTLPAPGSAVINAGQYRIDGGTATAIPSFTTTVPTSYTVAATNGTRTCELRFSNDAGSTWGPWSATKSATISVPPAYASVLMNNQGSASFSIPSDAYAGTSSFCTVGLHAKFLTGPTGQHYWYLGGANTIQFSYNYTNEYFSLTVRNASLTVLCGIDLKITKNVLHTVVASISLATTPVIQIYVDGVALANTGDVATGYTFWSGPIAGTIAWDRGSGQAANTVFADTNSMHIGEFFLKVDAALNPASFFSGTALISWAPLVDATTAIYMGNGMTAANWNAADAANLGYLTPLTNVGTTFVAV